MNNETENRKHKKAFSERRNLLAALGGLCFSLPFLCDYLIPFSVVGAALFYMSLRSENGGKRCFEKPFRRSMIFGLCFYIPLYYWFIALYPFDTFGFTMAQGFTVVACACIGISVYHSLFLAAVFSLVSLIRFDRRLVPAVFGFCFMADEYIISLGELGFSWGRVAVGQASFLPAVESVSLFGSYFITLVVVVAGAYAALFFVSEGARKRAFAVAALSIYLGNIALGTVLYFIPAEKGETIEAAVVQGNILSNEKWKDEDAKNGKRYLSMVGEAARSGKYDLIVMPESCFPFILREGDSVAKELSALAEETGTVIALGAITKANSNTYNSFLAVDVNGEYSEPYYKRHLVPFGEYMPYEDFFSNISFVEKLNLGSLSYTAGDSARVITLENGIRLGGQVCFDSIYSDLSRDSARDGAQIIVVVTNDSWYEDTRAVYQHAAFSKLRAIENGRCVVRAANTGVSMLIDPKGNVLASIPPLVQGTTSAQVYTSDSRTLFYYVGDSVLAATPLVILILNLIFIINDRRKKHESRNDQAV